MSDGAQKRVEEYLGRLRRRLRGMRGSEADEIVKELRAHILDKASMGGGMTLAAVDATLAALGSPEGLAAEYVTDELFARAEVSRSPLRVLRGVFHWASFSVAGFVVFLATVLGYSLGVIFALGACAKILNPHTAGLWMVKGADDYEFSLHLGFGSVAGPGRELLGWWIVPLGLLLGCGLLVLTTRFAVWCVRKYRTGRALRAGAR